MSWNKLESRTRSVDFTRPLKAQIHDPLWMLGRQWQMGEFKGNDTGSGIIARSVMDYSEIVSVGNIDETPKQYDFLNAPLESIIESIQYKFSIKERLLLANKWKKLMESAYAGPPTSTGYNSLLSDIEGISELIVNLDIPTMPSSDEVEVLKQSEFYSQNHISNFISTVKLKDEILIDGFEIYKLCLTNNSDTEFINKGVSSLGSINIGTFNSVCTAFKEWVNKMYSLEETYLEFWNKSKLEYEVDIYDNENTRLTALNSHNGDMDWYSFEQNGNLSGGVPNPAPEVKEILMTENRFAGMPSSRWWEFENGRVNFGNLEGNTTDIAKIVLTQFALVYQDDWFVIPYNVPIGSYSKLEGIVVTDVFGVKTYVANHTQEYNSASGQLEYTEETWKDWNWMDVSLKDDVINFYEPSGRMLLLPTIPKRMVSDPIESVTFMRDELSNLVWALEKIVPNNLGQGADAQQFSQDYINYLKELVASLSAPTSTLAPDPKLDYTLMNSVPENWIPFIAKHLGSNNTRDIELQRASMPRIMENFETSLVRPRTDLLSYGLNNGPVIGYKINEEEVSRAGTKIETTFQRTRWFNGKTIMWVGRNRTSGKGQGNSGLAFDQIADREPEE